MFGSDPNERRNESSCGPAPFAHLAHDAVTRRPGERLPSALSGPTFLSVTMFDAKNLRKE
jgi:hypothetical protein